MINNYNSYIQKIIPSPIGALRIVCSQRGVKYIYFEEDDQNATSIPYVDALNTTVEMHTLLGLCIQELEKYFTGNLRQFTVPLELEGTAFQLQVWNALNVIPYGKTSTYHQQALHIGNPLAIRAVGTANGRNPIPIILPCHRVIGSNGEMTGYGGGIWRKKALLAHEFHFASAAERHALF